MGRASFNLPMYVCLRVCDSHHQSASRFRLDVSTGRGSSPGSRKSAVSSGFIAVSSAARSLGGMRTPHLPQGHLPPSAVGAGGGGGGAGLLGHHPCLAGGGGGGGGCLLCHHPCCALGEGCACLLGFAGASRTCLTALSIVSSSTARAPQPSCDGGYTAVTRRLHGG